MALNIKHIRFFNLFGFTRISGTIDIDKDTTAQINNESTNQTKCEEEKQNNLRTNRNDEP